MIEALSGTLLVCFLVCVLRATCRRETDGRTDRRGQRQHLYMEASTSANSRSSGSAGGRPQYERVVDF